MLNVLHFIRNLMNPEKLREPLNRVNPLRYKAHKECIFSPKRRSTYIQKMPSKWYI